MSFFLEKPHHKNLAYFVREFVKRRRAGEKGVSRTYADIWGWGWKVKTDRCVFKRAQDYPSTSWGRALAVFEQSNAWDDIALLGFDEGHRTRAKRRQTPMNGVRHSYTDTSQARRSTTQGTGGGSTPAPEARDSVASP